MKSAVNILLGVVASIVYYPIQKYVLEWPYPWDIVSTAGVLIVAIGFVTIFRRSKIEGTENGLELMSDIEADRGMKARIAKLETTKPPSRVLSNVKVQGGSADFEIKDTKL